MKYLVTILPFVFLLIPSIAFNQKSINSWSIDACFGGTNPVKPYTPGYWSNTVSFFHTSGGVRYMFNNKFGIKLDGGYDRVTNDVVGVNGNSLPFKSHYYRTSIQGVLDIGRIFTFENFSEKTSLLFHFGGGASLLTSKVASENDRMVNFLFGFTPQYKISKRLAINVDASFIWHIYQKYTFDMHSTVAKRGFDGFIANATVGVNYYLGKNPEHYDWSYSPCYPDMRYLEDENNKLKLEKEELAKKLGDDDNDGVINYLDEEDNTEIGALVDIKGRNLKNIDTDGDGIFDFYDECPNEKGDQVNNGCPEKAINNVANNQNNNNANNNSNNPNNNNNSSNQNNNNANNNSNNPNNNNNSSNQNNNNANNNSNNPNNNNNSANQNNNSANNNSNNPNNNNNSSNQNNNNANNNSNNPNSSVPEYTNYVNAIAGMTSVTDLHFSQWQSTFLPQENALVSEVVSMIKNNPSKKIVIVGHADNGGEFSKKMDISKKRAESVKKFLVNSGISPDKIEIQYVGDLEPKFLNTTTSGKFLNRRAEIFIEK
jgi:OOP family OmpA-OmpF porin